jgi:hypothetical protein
MKKQFKSCLVIILLALTQMLSVSLIAQDSRKSPSILGTFIYELDEQEGMCIVTKTHFVWVLTGKNRKPFQGAEPTEAEKAAAYTGTNSEGGTYKYVGPSRITIHRLFSTNPGLVGKEFTFEYEFEGELCKYWILQSDGSRGPMGKSRRIAK